MSNYNTFKDEAPGEEVFAALNTLVDSIRMKEQEVEEVAQLLEHKQEELRVLNHVQLVNLMEELQLREFTTTSGLKVEVGEKIECALSESRRGEALRWLDDNGHGGMIKRSVGVDFTKNQQSEAEALIADLTGRFAAITEKKTVHPSTLRAWVREMLREGKDFPLETFGVFRRKVAEITELGRRK